MGVRSENGTEMGVGSENGKGLGVGGKDGKGMGVGGGKRERNGSRRWEKGKESMQVCPSLYYQYRISTSLT